MSYRCPRCGRETVYSEELEGLCEDCFREKYKIHNLDKLRVNIKICPICGRVKFGDKWIRSNKKNLKQLILSQVKKKKDIRGYNVIIELNQTGDETPLPLNQLLSDNFMIIPATLYKKKIMIQAVMIEIKITKQICPLCHKKASGKYYEYIIHVRFTGGRTKEKETKVREIIKSVLSHAKPDVFIDVKKIRKGIDIKISDRKIGDRLLHRIIDTFNTDAREYSERRFEASLNKHIVIKKAMVDI